MATTLTPQQIAEKQVRRGQAAVQDYKNGVLGVKKAPTQSAAEAVDRWFQGLTKSYNDGSFVDGCNAVSLADWAEKTAGKGAMNYGPGLQAAQGLIADFHAQRDQAQKSIDAELNATPRGDLQTNIQRMVIQATRMSEFKFKKRRK
jgi:hypothetical protein